MTKKGRVEKQSSSVFTYVVGEIGETRDTKRFIKDERGEPIRNDLDDCTQQFIAYKSGISIGKSTRSKIIKFDEFDTYSDWLIEKKLTEEEKIEIGLVKPEKKVSEGEFVETLTNVNKYLKGVIKKGLPKVEKKHNFVEKTLKTYFEFPTIKGLTEKYIRNNPGNIPVYGGRQFEDPVGCIADNLPNVKYFENCLAWNREGSVGYVFYHDHKFTTNDHHRPMVLKEEYEGKISLRYVRAILQKELLSSDLFEWSKTASKEKIRAIKLSFPVDEKGELDFITQERIADRLEEYDKILHKLQSEVNMVCESVLDIYSV